MRVLGEVASTQDLARQAAADTVPVVIVAHRQTAGRGRTGAGWETAPRAIAVSVAFRMSLQSPFSLTAGVAARQVLGDTVTLKWPNDLLVGDGKVGGILVEGFNDVVVAGMGLNLYWPEPPPGAAALFEADPGIEAGPQLARAWSSTLLDLTTEDRWPHADYVAACSTLGQDVEWEPEGHGRAIDVAEDGSLVVLTEAGEQQLNSGAIRHVRKARFVPLSGAKGEGAPGGGAPAEPLG